MKIFVAFPKIPRLVLAVFFVISLLFLSFSLIAEADSGNTWNTFLSGNAGGIAESVVVDCNGNIYITGVSWNTWGSPIRAHSDDTDAFAAKLDKNGNVIWNTFLGGGGHGAAAYSIALDSNGNIYIAGGSTGAWGSPVRPYTVGATPSNLEDTFAAKLDNNGNLIWNTFLGGDGTDLRANITVDSLDNVYVAGYSGSSWGSPVRPHSEMGDAFIAKLDDNGNLTWNTFLGGNASDNGDGGIIADNTGHVYIAGYSGGTWGSPIRPYQDERDVFVAMVDSSGGELQWNTFLGTTGRDIGDSGIAVDGIGNLYVAGYSEATWGSPLRAHSGSGFNFFVAKLNVNGDLAWNTFLGGNNSAWAWGDIIVDASGYVYVSGRSEANWGSPIRSYSGNADAFVAKLDSNGSVNWHTFLGGTSNDSGRGIAYDSDGNVLVCGYASTSWGYPIRAYSGTGVLNAFATKLDIYGRLEEIDPLAIHWHLNGNGFLEESGAQSGSVSVPLKTGEVNGSQMWTWEQPASGGAVFPLGKWVIKLGTTDWSSSCLAQIGKWNGSSFIPFNSTPVQGTFKDGFITININAGSTWEVPVGDKLALVIYNSGSSSHTISTDGSSYLSVPPYEPNPPVPELPTVILLGTGLVGLMIFSMIKRRKSKVIPIG